MMIICVSDTDFFQRYLTVETNFRNKPFIFHSNINWYIYVCIYIHTHKYKTKLVLRICLWVKKWVNLLDLYLTIQSFWGTNKTQCIHWLRSQVLKHPLKRTLFKITGIVQQEYMYSDAIPTRAEQTALGLLLK